MSKDENEGGIHIPKEPMSPRSNKVDTVLVCPVVDLELLLQRRVDQDDDLEERWIYPYSLISYSTTYLESLYEVDGDGLSRVTPKVPHENIGIQFRKTRDGCVGSRLSKIILAKEELK